MDNLLIGIIESEQQIEDQLSDWKINKIGGYPVLSPNTTKDVIHCFNSLVCDLCQKSLAFVLQMYCPVDDSLTDRLIYLFVCINRECLQNKWFAIRSVTVVVDKNDKKLEDSNQSDDSKWLDGQTEWETDDMEDDINEKFNECADSLAKMSVEMSKCEPIVLESMAFFRPLYISVIEEPPELGTNDKHINSLIESYECSNSDHKSGGNSGETYEQNYLQTIYRNDRKNYEFFKCLSVYPKQIIRYQWMATPLVNSDNHNPIPSKCEGCGANRSFEFQLMPALISYLKCLDTKPIDIDFGTVLIYTCPQNCVKSNSLIMEQTITLSDPDNELMAKLNE